MVVVFTRGNPEPPKNAINLLGGGFKYVFIFTPIEGNDPIWRAYVSDELVQPPTRFRFSLDVFLLICYFLP